MPTIFVCSRTTGGHRRAGKFIPDAQTELEVTDEQLARIKADPGIMVMVKAEETTEPETPPLTEADRYIPSQSEYVKAGYQAENFPAFAAGREKEIRARGGEPIFGKEEPSAPKADAKAADAPKAKK